MEKMNITMENFKLEDFVNQTIEANEMISSFSVFTFNNPEDIEHEDEDYEQKPANEVIKKFLSGDYLYANFSNCGIEKPVINCIDGGEYLLLDEEEASDYFEDEEDMPEDFVPTNGIYLDDSSSLGYLLKLENDVISLQAVRHSMEINGFVGPCGIGSREGVEYLDNTGVFGRPMKEYINGFIK